ncbi:ATP-dependent helicase [candidate division WWE3 bacterium CG_4_9_14_0_2_um_filter_35_11]|uniref:ATP-dependent helicase n=1 Tax=candidate division WWE3 bacterium CG_4_9_14_0_2_um_filter_35_11 TaxID=1975077 RepID=A0A2M8EMH0_UNCKA|nr:MAG: RNA helicase [candidate division WWE3 bacterium CG10_big_fil_rev_8_21_14_0_10_35_32]PJC23943.1 MAG: ATP-dependent helicase [candidate division WWE3 bacterium CG_4_9_14_0_2_um_filter_35_11]
MYKKPYGRFSRSTPSRFGGPNRGRRQGFSSRSSFSDFSKYINKNPEALVEEIYTPQTKITELNINERLKNNILQKGYKDLTPIQDKTIPLIIDGKDIIGIANTGTGKTGAFLIPMINKTYSDINQKVLIIAPTRELAQQINTEFRSFASGMNLFSTLCIGGTSMFSQRKDLNRVHNFLICTPGRVKDLAQRGWVNLSLYNNIVIDEVDRMFDMGFQKDISLILGLLPKTRQALFFSATVSNDIEILINKYLVSPIKISINEKKSATHIMQDIIRTSSPSEKMTVLHDMLIKPEFSKVLIFIKTKWSLNEIEKELKDRGFLVTSIHGNKTQVARQKSLAHFRENRTKILLATDVAARGLDIDNVSHVINFDRPATYDDYIHRIGRTGRGNKKGIALTFVN